MIRVGLVVPDFGNPFFASLAQIVTRMLSQFDASCLVMSSEGDPDGEQDAVEALVASDMPGLLIVPVARESHAAEHWTSNFTATVVLDRAVRGPRVDCVRGDNRAGMESAVGHLTARGHTSIGFIGGSSDTTTAEERRNAFEAECRRREVHVDGNLFEGDFTFGGGSRAAEELLSRPPATWPSAIVAANDLTAIGLMRKLGESGVGVPGDISVVGFDDMPLAGAVSPRLTTVRQDVRGIASAATQLIIDRIEQAQLGSVPSSTPSEYVIKPELVERESTSQRRGGRWVRPRRS